MNTVFKKIKYFFLALIFISVMHSAAFAAQVIDVSFAVNDINWERNSIVTVGVVLTATDEAVDVAGLELSFDYDSTKFKGVPTMYQDNFTTNLFVNDLSLSTPGTVLYRKGKTDPYRQTINAGQSWTAFVLEFRVTNAIAQEGSHAFSFKVPPDDVTNRAGSSVAGTFTDATYTVITDTTPPIVEAVPGSVTMNASTYQTITLRVNAADRSADLDFIRYTIDGSDPKSSGTAVNYSSPVTIPQNAYTTLRFFGQDVDGNDSNVVVETYTVDTDYPGISPITREPTHGTYGTVVTVNFTVDEFIQSNILVLVDGRTAVQHPSSSYPNYVYTYTIQGIENQGSRTISVRVDDLAGNRTTNTSQSIIIDFTSPTFSVVSITPRPAQVGQPLTVVYRANEQLSATTTLNVCGHETSRGTETAVGGGIYEYEATSPVLTGSETTPLVTVQGYDLAENFANSTKGWGDITVTGYDIYNNVGSSTANVEVDYIED